MIRIPVFDDDRELNGDVNVALSRHVSKSIISMLDFVMTAYIVENNDFGMDITHEYIINTLKEIELSGYDEAFVEHIADYFPDNFDKSRMIFHFSSLYRLLSSEGIHTPTLILEYLIDTVIYNYIGINEETDNIDVESDDSEWAVFKMPEPERKELLDYLETKMPSREDADSFIEGFEDVRGLIKNCHSDDDFMAFDNMSTDEINFNLDAKPWDLEFFG